MLITAPKNFLYFIFLPFILSNTTMATPSDSAHQEHKKSSISFKSDEDKVSYIIGHQIANNIQNDELKVNRELLLKSIEDGLNGKSSELTAQESQSFMQSYIAKQQKTKSERNLKDGTAFLEKNKSEKSVVTLPSGLQYKILTAGTGAKPQASDTVSVDYEGTLINGKVFDSSYQRGVPISFPVNGVIKGWTEALKLMPVGSTWMLYIPSDLAYGPQSPSPLIGPNSTLVFKVHLISIASKKDAVASGDASQGKKK